MFYSHHLLARKAPMGQIWMAATLHAKINRRKLDKLNIIKICEEILNPSVPMALRLSGILMGGVVIVYERKVKLLYDDVTRLLVEVNEAWKVKPVKDPTVLPKGKTKARKEAVTLPEKEDTDIGDDDQSLQFSNATTLTGFQQTSYFAMRLDDVEEISTDKFGEEDICPQAHQADAADITLRERFDLYQADADMYNGFERFDFEGDEETQVHFTTVENMQIPSTLVPSPTAEKEPEKDAFAADDVEDWERKVQDKRQSDIAKEENQLRQNQYRQGAENAAKRKTKRPILMDYEQTFIPGHVYQSWLQDSSDIISSRGPRGIKRKPKHIISTMKVTRLMDLPPVAVCYGLIEEANGLVYYPAPLLKHLMRSMQLPLDSPSVRASHVPPPEPSSSSPPNKNPSYQGPVNVPFADGDGLGSQSHGHSIEKQRVNLYQNDMPADIFMDGLKTNLMSDGVGVTEGNFLFTPGNSAADDLRSIPSSGSGHGFSSQNIEANSGPSNRKRPRSASKHSSGGLEPVAEENTLQHPHPYFELSRLSENGSPPEQELLVETGPTQTQHQHPITNLSIDKIADTIRTQMKSHFETPGAPQTESLNNLAYGMDRKRAAVLFYQTCVLATHEILKVEQNVPYGDISITRGKKM